MMLTNSETSRAVMSLARLETRAPAAKVQSVPAASCLLCTRGDHAGGFLG